MSKRYLTGNKMQKGTRRITNKNRRGCREYTAQYFNRAFAHCSSDECENELVKMIARLGYDKQIEIWHGFTDDTKKKIARTSFRLGY